MYKRQAERITPHLDLLIRARFGRFEDLTISAWWPIKAELNLRHWLTDLVARGVTVDVYKRQSLIDRVLSK